MDNLPAVLTPKQVARYLQVNPETIYRYIRQGKLSASRLGRSYRITRDSVDRLLLITRSPSGVPVRRYNTEELLEFIKDDQLDPAMETTITRFIQASEARSL
jgi:excisionase family DNA binding protein